MILEKGFRRVLLRRVCSQSCRAFDKTVSHNQRGER
jgi:hypothetical protein